MTNGKPALPRVFLQLTEVLADAVFVSDGNVILAVNSAMVKLVAASKPEEVIGRNHLQFLPEALRSEGGRRVTRAITGQPNPPIESTLQRLDGTTVEVEISSTGSEIDGVPVFIGIVRDLSQLSQARRAAIASEERFDSIFHRAAVGMALIDLEGNINIVNPRFAEILGRDRESLQRSSINDVLPPEDIISFAELIERLRRGEVTRHTMARRLLADDRPVWCRISISLLGEQGEDSERIVVALEDIDDKKKAEARVLESEKRFRTLLEQGSELIEIVDLDGHITWASGASEQLLNLAPEKLVGRSIFEFIHEDDLPTIREQFRHLAQEHERVVAATARVVRTDGSTRYVEATGTNLFHIPYIEGIVLNVRDLTERKVLEETMERSRRVESLGRVASTMTHEFNNILMGMQPWVDVLERKFGNDPQIRKITANLGQAIKRGGRTTNEIRRFTTSVSPQKKRLQLHSWSQAFVDELAPQLPENVQISLDATDSHLELYADPELLHHALTNLVLNAKDAMSDGGTIILRMHHCRERGGCNYPPVIGEERFVHIEVEDEGMGVSEDVRRRMFDPLFTTKHRGTGLGLALVEQIVTRHCGRLFVESEEGKGTSIHIFLPDWNRSAGSAPPACAPS